MLRPASRFVTCFCMHASEQVSWLLAQLFANKITIAQLNGQGPPLSFSFSRVKPSCVNNVDAASGISNLSFAWFGLECISLML